MYSSQQVFPGLAGKKKTARQRVDECQSQFFSGSGEKKLPGVSDLDHCGSSQIEPDHAGPKSDVEKPPNLEKPGIHQGFDSAREPRDELPGEKNRKKKTRHD